jgi:hypothetical protein
MIIYATEMHDKTDDINIQQSIVSFGGGELEIWKKYALADQSLFNQLFSFIFNEDQRLAWRACWVVDKASEEHPDLLQEKIPEIISGFLATKNGSLKRHFTRILCRYQLPEESLGTIINRSFDLLNPSEPIAVRVFAMQLLFNITLQVPELKGELISVIENLLEEVSSAGFVNRAGKLLLLLRS